MSFTVCTDVIFHRILSRNKRSAISQTIQVSAVYFKNF